MAHPKRCFRCIESLASLGAPIAVWQRELGDSFDAVMPLLVTTDRIAQWLPGARTDLPMMRVVDYRDDRFAAVCDEEMSPKAELAREQVVLRRVDEAKLRAMLCEALSLIESRDDISQLPGLLRVGTWQSSPADQRPVVLAIASNPLNLVELCLAAMTSNRGPVVLLTPTRSRWSTRSEAALDPSRATLVPLDEVLEWNGGGWRRSALWEQFLGAAPPRIASQPAPGIQVDDDTFTVLCGDKSCRLGNTVGFRAIRRLARRPGQYVSIADLLEDAWGGAKRTESAVQKAMCGLRKKFAACGLREITIDGSEPGHYALKFSVKGKR